MTTYNVEESELEHLRDKNILVFGGCTGIGKAAVQLALDHGANVVLGDWNADVGKQLAQELGPRFCFQQCDVSRWDSVVGVFDFAVSKLHTIDAVLGNAGVAGDEGLVEHSVDVQSGKLKPPNMKTMDINLYGQIYVTKCTLYYCSKWPDTRCQLVLTGSAASYVDAPSLGLYTSSKHGVLGLMRGLRGMIAGGNVTMNVIAPWATDTQMFSNREGANSPITDVWKDMPLNTPSDVARAQLLPLVRPAIHGKAFWVGGGDIIELEDKIQESQPSWLTKEMSDKLDEGQRRIVVNWAKVVLSYKE